MNRKPVYLFFILFNVASTLAYSHGPMTMKQNRLLASWNNDVYTGREWNDNMTPSKESTSIVKTAGVLLLYTPQCLDEVIGAQLSDWARPQHQYLCFMKHDCETSPKHVWYHLDEKDRLCERYKYDQLKCGTYLFFANSSDINTPTEVYDSESYEGNVNEWMWDKVSTTLTVINKRDETIEVEVRGRGPKVADAEIAPGETAVLKVHQSYVVLVQTADDKRTFLHGTVLDQAQPVDIIIDESSAMTSHKARPWWKKQDAMIQKQSQELRSWRWRVAEIYLLDFKQTPLLPKFTHLGYKKGTMPAEMYAKVLSWYRDNMDNRTPEKFNVEPAINDSEVKCAMVFLEDDMKKYIGTVMKPYLEEWSNISLEMTRLYGIREYFHGNILRNHVDRITTHIISVILQIDKDLDGGADWELEIIDFDGMRKNVTLEPGEMLFYESSTLIHGRPFPFQGKRFANAFLHYVPASKWPWSMSNDGFYLLKDGEPVEPTNSFSTINTYRGGVKPHRHTEDL